MKRARHREHLARRDFLRQGLAWALAGSPLIGLAATPEEVARLAQAESRMHGLDALRKRARDTGSEADDLAGETRSIRETWDEAMGLHGQIAPAIDAARRALEQLGAELDAGDAALRADTAAAAESRRAATRLADDAADRISPAASEANAAFIRRRDADAALQAQQRRIGTAANTCADALGKMHSLIGRTAGAAARLGTESEALKQDFAALREAASQTLDAARSARSARWFSHVAEAQALPAGDAIERLHATTARARPDDASQPDGIAQLFERASDSAALAAALGREEDAASVRALMLARCSDDACTTLQAEDDELKPDLDLARADLAGLQQRLAALRTRLPGIPDQARQWADAMGAWLDQVAPAIAPALDEANLASSQVKAFAAPLAAAAAVAYEQARSEWSEAYRLAYGTLPPERRIAAKASAAQASASAPTVAMTSAVLRSHAYERVSVLDGERRGFGAYTYVLLRSGRDLDTPAVSRRYGLLLQLLENDLPEAATIPEKVARNVNLFCIPVAAPGASPVKAGRPAYGAALAGQWLLNAQHGLLTRKEILARLIRSPGPFLLTLPGRLAESTPGMPLLFADLNDYSDIAIGDLVTQYMTGLLEAFPTEQAQWTPPALQQVALTMIHLAGDLGHIVERAIPTATARAH